MICTSYNVFPHKDLSFMGRVDIAFHFGVICPKKTILGALIGIWSQTVKLSYYQNYCSNSNQIKSTKYL